MERKAEGGKQRQNLIKSIVAGLSLVVPEMLHAACNRVMWNAMITDVHSGHVS